MDAGRRCAVRQRRRPERADRLALLDRRADLEGGLDGLERRPESVRVHHHHHGAVDHDARDGHHPGGRGHDGCALGAREVHPAVAREPGRSRDVDVREEQARGHQRRPLEGGCRRRPERQDVQPGGWRGWRLAPGGARCRERRRHHERREHEDRHHHAHRGPRRGAGPREPGGGRWPGPGRDGVVRGHVRARGAAFPPSPGPDGVVGGPGRPAGVAFHPPSLPRRSGPRPGTGEGLWTYPEPGGAPHQQSPVD